VNEFCHELALKNMSEEEKLNLGGMKKLGIDLGSGITAGAAAAILSHVRVPLPPPPADR
jgi:solute carrier family 25 phosphate transporter 3